MTYKWTMATAISALALAVAAPISAHAAEGDEPPKAPEIINQAPPADAPAEAKQEEKQQEDKRPRSDRANRDRGDDEGRSERQKPDSAEREERRERRDSERRSKEEPPAPVKEPVKEQPLESNPPPPPPPVEAAPKPKFEPPVKAAKPAPSAPPVETAPKATPPVEQSNNRRPFDRRDGFDRQRARDDNEGRDRQRRDVDQGENAGVKRPAPPKAPDVEAVKPQQAETDRPVNIFQDRGDRIRAIQEQRRAALRRAFGGGGQPAPTLEDIKSKRKERREDGGKRVVIEEPDNRTIIQQDNRIAIERNERERMRRFAPNARIESGPGKSSIAVVERGAAKIYTETDDRGRLVRRYRRDPSGRETIIIDNRRRKKDKFGRDLAIGAGIGAGVVAGAVLLDSLVRVPPPRVMIPREKYIVRGSRASEDDYYEALSAPPVDRYDDRYTLDEIRATSRLRERMRRVDLDDITFEFGAWDIDPSQYRKLERLARAIKRVLRRNPDDVFMIEGHTDAVGSRVDNLTLSDRRAETVAYILTREFDVPFESLVTQGYGEEYLKIPTPAPERLNRRVAAINITPLLDRGFRGARAEGPPRYDRDGDRGGYDDRDDRRDDDYRDGRSDDRGYDEPDDDRYEERRGSSRY